MNEVEKMYSNAGIKADRIVCYRGFDNCIDNDLNCHCHNEKPCKDAAKIYPPFTAEKQLELIKWLAVKVKGDFDSSIDIAKNTYDYWTMYFGGTRWTAEGFEETLAGLINNLRQSLTEAEKAQIKNILESEVRE